MTNQKAIQKKYTVQMNNCGKEVLQYSSVPVGYIKAGKTYCTEPSDFLKGFFKKTWYQHYWYYT